LFWLADSSLIFKIGTLVLDVIHHLGTYCRSDACNRGLLFASLGNVGSVHLTLRQADQLAVAVAVLTVQDDFAASGAKIARHRWDSVSFAFMGMGQVAGVMD
jgi:hypothetical protein